MVRPAPRMAAAFAPGTLERTGAGADAEFEPELEPKFGCVEAGWKAGDGVVVLGASFCCLLLLHMVPPESFRKI
jgi:hypothetical protein